MEKAVLLIQLHEDDNKNCDMTLRSASAKLQAVQKVHVITYETADKDILMHNKSFRVKLSLGLKS